MSVICCSLSGFSQHTWTFCNWQRRYLKQADVEFCALHCTIYTALFSSDLCVLLLFPGIWGLPKPQWSLESHWKHCGQLPFFSLQCIPDSMLLLTIILQYSERLPSSDCISLKTIHVFVLLCEWTFHNRTAACKTAPKTIFVVWTDHVSKMQINSS